MKQVFIDSIDDYLAFCKERNEQPEKPFSGKFNLRISAELHRKVFIAAKQKGVSINTWISDTLNHVI
jgi:predicted HicB family RNase H-like nuclease